MSRKMPSGAFLDIIPLAIVFSTDGMSINTFAKTFEVTQRKAVFLSYISATLRLCVDIFLECHR